MLYGKRGGSPPWTQLSDKSSPWCPVTTLTAFTFLTQPPAGRKRPSVVLTMFHATLGSLRVSSGAIVGAKEQLHGGLSTIALILSFSTLPFVFTVIFFMSTRWFWNELYLLPQRITLKWPSYLLVILQGTLSPLWRVWVNCMGWYRGWSLAKG